MTSGLVRLPVILSATLFAACGCRSARLASDQTDFRRQLLNLYTEQLIDNLIRARRGLPIVHVDYTNFTGTVTDTGNGSIGFMSPSGVGSYLGAGSRVTQLTVTGNPVVTSREVYLTYLAFLNIPGSLIETMSPPPPGAAHIVKYCDGVYYSVPMAHRADFFNLAIRTTARGSPLPPPDGFKTTIQHAYKLDDNSAQPALHSLVLSLRPMVPLAEGSFKVLLSDNVTYSFRVGVPDDDVRGATVQGTTTDTLQLNYRETTPARSGAGTVPISPDRLMRELEKKDIEIVYPNVRPPAPDVETLLRGIFQQNQLQRLDALGRAGQ